jgi:Bacterial Ig domain
VKLALLLASTVALVAAPSAVGQDRAYTVTFGTTFVQSGTTTSGGGSSGTFNVPSGYTGATTVKARTSSATVNNSFNVTASPAKIDYTQHCSPSDTTVTLGDTVTAQGTIKNSGGTSITLPSVILAIRPPGGTNGGGPFDNFVPIASNITLGPGQSYTQHASRTFTSNDPTRSWYCFMTYQAPDGTWHDDPSNTTFTVSASQLPPDTTPPTVSLTAPADGASASGATTLSANASDDVAMDHVSFRVDGKTVNTDSTAPYSYSWDSTTVPDGSHRITALAVDTAGNSTPSSAATVTVSNATQPPPPPSGVPIRNRVGVNVHMNYGGPYGSVSGVASKLSSIGVGLIRDALPSDFNKDAMPRAWNTFAGVDVMAYCVGSWQFSWGWTNPKACVDQLKSAAARAVAVEGANEPYCNNQSLVATNYAQLTNQMVAIRDEANVEGLDAYTISMCNANSWGTTKIAGMVNNPHAYNSSGYPTYGPASTTFSTQWWKGPGFVISDSGRWGASETGASLGWAGGNQTLQARYNLVTALNDLKAGMERFALYQLADETCQSGGFGWYDCNGNPRAVVGVMRNFYSVLGNATTTSGLSGNSYSVTGSNVNSLTATDDANQYIVLWHNASAPQSDITLSFGSPTTIGIIRPMSGAGVEARASSASHVIALSDDPLIVRIP